uniref:Protein kinase domain-containing protein n=1 Tax=Anopheles minimus TaxID=112268 RepID=A0A182WHT4_9DIPT
MDIITNKIRRGSFDLNSSIWLGVSESAKNLVRSLLTVNPKHRITMQELQSHEWLCEGTKRRGQHSSLSAYSRGLPSQTKLSFDKLQVNVRNTYDAFKLAEQSGFRLHNEGANRRRSAGVGSLTQATVPAHRERRTTSNSGTNNGELLEKSNSITTVVPNHQNALSSSSSNSISINSSSSKTKRIHQQNDKKKDAGNLPVSSTKSIESQYSSSMEESTSSGIGRSKSSKSSLSHSGSPLRDTRQMSNSSVVIVIDEDEDERDVQSSESLPDRSSAVTNETAAMAIAVEGISLGTDSPAKQQDGGKSAKENVEEQTDEIVIDVEEEETSKDVEMNKVVTEVIPSIRNSSEAEKNNNDVVDGLVSTTKQQQQHHQIEPEVTGSVARVTKEVRQIMNEEEFSDTTKELLGATIDVEPVLGCIQAMKENRPPRKDRKKEQQTAPAPVHVAGSSTNSKVDVSAPHRTIVTIKKEKLDKEQTDHRADGGTSLPLRTYGLANLCSLKLMDQEFVGYRDTDCTLLPRSISVHSDNDDIVYLGYNEVDEPYFGFGEEECERFYGCTVHDLRMRSQLSKVVNPNTVEHFAYGGLYAIVKQEPRRITKRRAEITFDVCEPRPKRFRQIVRKNYSLTGGVRRNTFFFGHSDGCIVIKREVC